MTTNDPTPSSAADSHAPLSRREVVQALAQDRLERQAGAAGEPSGKLLWSISREFALLWRRDCESAADVRMTASKRELEAGFRQELAAASEAVKVATASFVHAHIEYLLQDDDTAAAVIHPDVRLRNLVSELVACGLAPDLPAAAILAGKSLLAPGFPGDVARVLAKVDETQAQKLMRTLLELGAPVEQLQAALALSGVKAHVLKPFAQACDALATEQSMTTIIAGASQPAADAMPGTAPGATRRSAL